MQFVVQQCPTGAPSQGQKFSAAIALFLAIDVAWLVVIPLIMTRCNLTPWHLHPVIKNAGIKWQDKTSTVLASVVGFVAVAVISAFVASTISAPDAPAAAGALVGFVIFSVYDITTWVTIPGWTSVNAVIDTAYGSAVWAVVLTVLHAAFPTTGVCPD